jgi:DNA-binding transcriptional LysR family regulator
MRLLPACGFCIGVEHSTVSRRIGALERELKAPVVERGAQGCTLTPLGRQLLHSCEQVESAVTVFQQMCGRPEQTDYRLGLYASNTYLRERGVPQSTRDLSDHSLIYYIEGLLRGRFTSLTHAPFGSTSVHAQLQAALHGGGIGLLPAFVAEREPSLERGLFDDVAVIPQFSCHLVPSQLRRPAATKVMSAIRAAVRARRDELLPTAC